MNVYVVTNPESGWDCVRGVYKTKRDAMLSKLDNYIHENNVDVDSLSDEDIKKLWNKECEDNYVIHDTYLK